MAVSINCFILCVWQFILVRSTGINLPFTSISYKASPINPKFLSLVFSASDGVESKATDNLEDFNPLKTSLSTQDEELSKKTVSVSELLSKLGLISENDSKPKDLNFSKQKQNVNPNTLYEVALPPQKNVPSFTTSMNDKSDVPKDLQNEKNPVNYNIKVISPPAVFNNFPISLKDTHNVGDTKMLSETNKYSKYVPPMSLLPYSVRSLTEDSKKESTTACQNVRQTFSNNKEGTMYKTVQPLVQKDIINVGELGGHQMRNIVKSEDIIVTPKDNTKFTCDLNINKTPFNIDSGPNNLLDYSSPQLPINFLDTSLNENLDILPTMCDAININQEMKPPFCPLSIHDTESNTDNMSTYNNKIDKQIPNYCSVQDIPSETPLSYVSAHPYTFDISPTLHKFSSPNLPEISKPQQIYVSDYDTYNLRLGSSLDNIVSFLTSKFILAFSDISVKNSIRAPLSAPEILHSHIAADAPVTLSDPPISFPVCVSNFPEVESPTYLPKPNIDIPITDNAKKSITKSSVPYISSVTINYMPCIESSDDIIIFV